LNHAADLFSRPYQLSTPTSITPSTLNSKAVIAAVSTRRRNKNKASDVEYEVDKILDKRPIHGRADEYEYLVSWKGYDKSSNTWEPLANLQHSTQTIVEFEKNYKKVQKLKKVIEKNNIKSDNHINNSKNKIIDEVVEEEQKYDVESSTHIPSSSVCELCNLDLHTHTQLYIHKFREHNIPIPSISLDGMNVTTDASVFKNLQEQEPEFRVIYNTDLGTSDILDLTSFERRILQNHEFVRVENGLLYCIDLPSSRSKSKLRTQLRLCVPKTERRRIIHDYHINNAHPGIVHQYDILRERVWWPRMLADVLKYVINCSLCQQSKGRKKHIKVQPTDIPVGPWTHVAVDHVGPLPTSNNGNIYILVVIDRFTRYAEAFAVPDTSTITTAKVLVEGIMCKHGFMMVLQSDRGSGFVSQLAAQIFKLLGVKQIKTTAFHPQANGVVEIFNKTLKTTLRIFASENQKDWDELLCFAIFSYNTSFHSTLQETPYYLNHGRQARTITDTVTDLDLLTHTNVHAYAQQLAEKLSEVHHRVREILQKINEERINDINENNDIPSYNIGDEVLLFDPTTPKHTSKKLVRRWIGPFTIIEKHNPVNYSILRSGKSQKVNVERLRKYNSEDQASVIETNNNDMLLAQQEIEALSSSILELQYRKQQLEHSKSAYEATVVVEHQQSSEDNLSSSIINANAVVFDESFASKWL
jgi:transposase InsO family protein